MVRRGDSDWHVHGPSLGLCGVYHKYKGSDSGLLKEFSDSDVLFFLSRIL